MQSRKWIIFTTLLPCLIKPNCVTRILRSVGECVTIFFTIHLIAFRGGFFSTSSSSFSFGRLVIKVDLEKFHLMKSCTEHRRDDKTPHKHRRNFALQPLLESKRKVKFLNLGQPNPPISIFLTTQWQIIPSRDSNPCPQDGRETNLLSQSYYKNGIFYANYKSSVIIILTPLLKKKQCSISGDIL